MRLEPGCRNADMSAGLQARIYDPLWLLARQWQVGEFQGEDNGSPAEARWQGECAGFTRYHPGAFVEQFFDGMAMPPEPIEGQVFDGNSIPLETLVECERARPNANKIEKLRFAAEAGRHFLRILDQQSISRSYREFFTGKYPFTPLTPEQRELLDADSLSFVDLIASRVPDGRKLYVAMRAALRPVPPDKPALPLDLAIAPADIAEVRTAAESWLDWYEMLVREPSSSNNTAWSDERMEYGFSVAARMLAGEKVLTAQEYFSGHTDWHDFNVNDGASLGAGKDAVGTAVTRTIIPTPVSYQGMPATRFWEFEDAQVDFGSINAGPEDLARMLLVEFAVSYGNDWFVIPVDLPVGSLCRTQSLVVTNTFGERFLIRSSNDSGEPYKAWRMFQLSSTKQPGQTLHALEENADIFLLPPALISSLESRPVEEVLFLRDEMANMAWGIERVIESATERPLNRFAQQRNIAPPLPEQTQGKLIYQLATDVPDNWVPLMPVKSSGGLRLRRAKMLKIGRPDQPIGALGQILNPNQAALAIFEEEIPREGIRVSRHYQLARWQDGSTHLWIGRRKQVGSGEGSSGLKFDTLEL
jgi:hypothetical protein